MHDLDQQSSDEAIGMLENSIRIMLERLGKEPETEHRRAALQRIQQQVSELRDDGETDAE